MTVNVTVKSTPMYSHPVRVVLVFLVAFAISQLAVGPVALLVDRGFVSRSTATSLETSLFLPLSYSANRSPMFFGCLKTYISMWASPPAQVTAGVPPVPVPLRRVQPGETFPPPIDPNLEGKVYPYPLDPNLKGIASPVPPQSTQTSSPPMIPLTPDR